MGTVRQVLVVGGTRGIGLAAARAFSVAGDRVRLIGVEADLLAARASEGLSADLLDVTDPSGCMCYVDDSGQSTGFEDVFDKIEMCRHHFNSTGLGADYVEQFIR